MYRFSPTQQRQGQGDDAAAAKGAPAGEATGSAPMPRHPLELKLEPGNIDTSPIVTPAVDDVTTGGPPLATSPATSDTTSLPGDAPSNILCLKWNGFQEHLQESLISIFRSEELADVTLVADSGELLKAHKIVLALSSPYFRKLFQENPCKHPIVFLQGINYAQVQQVLDFIYTGQVRVLEKEFDDFMEAAESLRIDGINANPSNFSDDSTRSGPEDSPVVSNTTWSFPFTTGQGHLPPLLPDDLMGGAGGPSGSALLRKRSSASSGISTGTGGPSTSCSPPLNLQRPTAPAIDGHRGLKVMLGPEATADPPPRPPPVLIEIDDEADTRWSFPPSPWSKRFPLNYPHPARRLHPEPSKVPINTVNPKRKIAENALSMAEDLSKPNSRQRFSPETYDLTRASSFQTPTGLLISTPPVLNPRNERRSTSWPLLDTPSRPPQATSPVPQMTSPKNHVSVPALGSPSHRGYFPFLPSSVPLPRPIPYNPLYFPSATVTQVANLPNFCFPQHRRLSIPTFSATQGQGQSGIGHLAASVYKRTSGEGSAPLKVTPRGGEIGQGRAPSPNFAGKYVMGIVPNPVRFSKPKTKTIRSSQVPQSCRYTASQVDSMVEKVENFPGPLVPCIVCQKFVKRERLRAHIHECHLLPREKIECPICKIGLKSKGSYRVHLWRHRRSKFGTDLYKGPGMSGSSRVALEGQDPSSSSASLWPPLGNHRSSLPTSPEVHHAGATSPPVTLRSNHSPQLKPEKR